MVSKKEQLEVLLEQNRSGNFKKIKIYKDKDNEDTTLRFRLRNRKTKEIVWESDEFIFKEDQSLPQCKVGEKWNPETKQCDPDPDVVDSPPLITGQHDVDARTGFVCTIPLEITDEVGTVTSIQWKQTKPTEKIFEELAGKQTGLITFEEEGDYLLVVTATDDKDQSTDFGINVKVRTVVIPPSSEFKSLIGFCADTDDADKAAISIKQVGKSPSAIFGGDGPYGDSAAGFINLWSSNVSITRTVGSGRGNHDHLEDSTKAVMEAMAKFFGWDAMPEGLSLHVSKVNNIGIINMDSQDPDFENKDGKQFQFVKASLEILKGDNMKFIIINVHKPFYGTTYKHGDEKAARAIYQPLFDEFGVDLVLQGHNHQTWETVPLKSGAKPVFTAIEGGYNFNEEHGQIYWGNGGGGRGLYTIGSNVPSYIKKWNDKDHSTCVIEAQENNQDRIRIRNISHAGKELNSVIIDKSGAQQPPDTTPKPPVIETDDMSVMIHAEQELQLTANVTDPNGNDTIESIEWSQPADQNLNFTTVNGGVVQNLFTVPTVEGNYEVTLTVKDKTGLTASQLFKIEVRPKVVEEEGMVKIWDSKEAFAGQKRTITDIEGDQSKPDSGYKRMNASGDPKLWVLGTDGLFHCILETQKGPDDDPETYGRWYLGKKNFNCMFRRVVRFLTESAITDSTKLDARHQFRDYCKEVLGFSASQLKNIPDSKVQGGVGFHVKRDKGGCQIEIVHGTQGDSVEKSLPFKIKTGEYYCTQYWVWHTTDGKLLVKHEIEYPLGSGMKTIVNQAIDAPKQFHNQADFDEWSELWVGRLNGNGGKIEYGDMELYKLTKKPDHMKE